MSRKHGESTIYKSSLWYIRHETSLIYARCYIGVIQLVKVWMEIIDDVMNILYIQKLRIIFVYLMTFMNCSLLYEKRSGTEKVGLLSLSLLSLGLLTINRIIDPGRRIEYNFLGSINRKAASTREHAALPRHAAKPREPQLCRDTRTRAQDRVHVPITINIETSCARPQGGRRDTRTRGFAARSYAATRGGGSHAARGTTLHEGRWHVDYIWRMA